MSRFPKRQVLRMGAPAIEPVSLNEAKSFLRIDHADEDAVISDMITAARIVAEEQSGKSLITQQWQIQYDEHTPQIVPLPHGPIQVIDAVKTVDKQGVEATLSSTAYYLNSWQELYFDAVPDGHKVVIEYTAGYGDAASDVPTDVVQAILMHVASLHAFRDTVSAPMVSQLTYAAHREVRV